MLFASFQFCTERLQVFQMKFVCMLYVQLRLAVILQLAVKENILTCIKIVIAVSVSNSQFPQLHTVIIYKQYQVTKGLFETETYILHDNLNSIQDLPLSEFGKYIYSRRITNLDTKKLVKTCLSHEQDQEEISYVFVIRHVVYHETVQF